MSAPIVRPISQRKANFLPIFKYIYRMNFQSSNSLNFLDRGNNNYLAYRQSKVVFEANCVPDLSKPRPKSLLGTSPTRKNDVDDGDEGVAKSGPKPKANGIMFLPGFLSNMNGGKALAVEQFCKKERYDFVRFDYQGCGESKGDFNLLNYPFDVWKEDALAVLDNLTIGPQVLVGSSMGGAIMLFLALERPERVHGLVGVAAPNYGSPSLFSKETQERFNRDDGKNSFNLSTYINERYLDIMRMESLAIHCPVRLIHSMKDVVVKYESALELANKIESEDVRVILQKSGTHRMSTPEGLQLLLKTLEDILEERFGDNGTFINQKYLDILRRDSLAIRCPVRLIHGMQDDVVKYETALDLANKVESEDVRVILQKSGTHRMSTPEGLQLLLKTVEDVL